MFHVPGSMFPVRVLSSASGFAVPEKAKPATRHGNREHEPGIQNPEPGTSRYDLDAADAALENPDRRGHQHHDGEHGGGHGDGWHRFRAEDGSPDHVQDVLG